MRSLLLALFLISLSPVSALPQWQPDGVLVAPPFQPTDSQNYPAVASDGSGGAIVAWSDWRSGVADDVYVQRLDASGVALWMSSGVPVCTAAGRQHEVAILSDGAGGAIVTWTDERAGSRDIYAQRVDSSGVTQWTADGVALCTATNWQQLPVIESDGASGAIVAWQDARGGAVWNIYAQRISAAGAPQWTANGVALCTLRGENPRIASDGASGCIVTWVDYRSGQDIYAGRITAAGTVAWAANGVAVCTEGSAQLEPAILADGSGGAFIAWTDQRPLNGIYAQRINGSGAVQWTANGIAVCTAPAYEPAMVTDGSGGTIIAWRDYRDGLTVDIYAQRVNGAGAAQWVSNGVVVCGAGGDQWSPKAVSDGAGGAVVAWSDWRFEETRGDIFAQRIDGAGAPVWMPDGVPLCIVLRNQDGHALARDGAGGAIVAWQDYRENDNSYIYAQKASVDLSQQPVTGTYVPLAPGFGNPLVGDVDARPRYTGTYQARSFLPFRNSLQVVNTVTQAVEAAIVLPSPAVQGIDFTHASDGQHGVMMTVGHLLFFTDISATPLTTAATFAHTDTPIPDCDPFFVAMGGSLYCVVPYVGSIRVFQISGASYTDLYTVTRSSVGIEAVDPVMDPFWGNLYVPNSTTMDLVTLTTGNVFATIDVVFPPKREVDPLLYNPWVFWPVDGAILQVSPLGYLENTILIPGTSVEGVDMAVSGRYGAFPTTGFLHLVDLFDGTFIASCPTPGAVVRNFDPLPSPVDFTGGADAAFYWPVIGTTYVVDVSSPYAPWLSLPTPGGLVDGCDLTASNDLTRGVLPHQGFVHVLDLSAGSVIGTINTPGALLTDVDPVFPPPPLLTPPGSRVMQPYSGGFLELAGFVGDPDACVLTTTTTVHVLSLSTLSLNSSFPIPGPTEGVDPVIVQGQTPAFDFAPFTARDIDQDFVCNEAQRVAYASRPRYYPAPFVAWDDPYRLPWYRSWGIPLLTYMDPYTRIRATVLSDRRTVAFNDLSGNLITDVTLPSPIIGGFAVNRDHSLFTLLLQDEELVPIELLQLNLSGSPPPLVLPFIPNLNIDMWPPGEDNLNDIQICPDLEGDELKIIDTRQGMIRQTIPLPQPAIFPPVVDYKNRVASALLRGGQRAIVNLEPLAQDLPATLSVVPFYPGETLYPVANTVYDPLNNCALNIFYRPATISYGFAVTGSLIGNGIWYHDMSHSPFPRILLDPKSKEAKVPTVNGREYVYNLAPLAWGASPIYTDIGLVYPWRWNPGLAYYSRWEVNVHGTYSVSIVDAYHQTLVADLTTSFAITGPPVVDAQNQYARVRLESGYSLFIDLFEFARGNLGAYRYDNHGADLADLPIFDPTGGIDVVLDGNGNITVSRPRPGQYLGSVNLPAQPVRPLQFDPHNRVLEAILPGGDVYQLDLSLVDGTSPVSLSLQQVNIGGQALAATDLTPPQFPVTGGVVASALGPDGVVKITAPPGTVEPRCHVTLGNLTNRSVELAEVMADSLGGFLVYVVADSSDTVCIITADVAGNIGPDTCFEVLATQVAVEEAPSLPTVLYPPLPNPSADRVAVSFSLEAATVVEIAVYDIAGRRVCWLNRDRLEAGRHELTWDGLSDDGRPVAAGMYFLRMTTRDKAFVQRIVRLR